jgi:hypothetical protein
MLIRVMKPAIDGGVEGDKCGWRRTFSCSNSPHPEVLARSASLEVREKMKELGLVARASGGNVRVVR